MLSIKATRVLLPLATIVYGCLTERLAAFGRAGRVAAVVLLTGWMTWGFLALLRDVKIRFRRPDYPPVASGVSTAASPSPDILPLKQLKSL